MMVLRSFPLSFCDTVSLFLSIIYLVKVIVNPSARCWSLSFTGRQGWQKFVKTAES